MNSSFKKQVISGMVWSVSGRIGFLAIGFLGNVLLARMLTPDDFGKMGIVMFFIAIGKVLTESGMGGALVRKQEVTDLDFSTVFVFNLVVSIAMCGLIAMVAEAVSDYYAIADLRWLLLVSSSILLIDAFQITYNTRLVRDLRYKRKSAYDLTAVTISSSIGVALAARGAGVWSIVGAQVSHSLCVLLLYVVFEERMSRWNFSYERFRMLYAFGVNTTVASIINTAFDNVYQLILGKHFSVAQTGLYFQAKKLEQVPVGLIKSTTMGVVFSALSKLQDDKQVFMTYYLRIVTIFSMMTGFICGFVFLYSEGVIRLVYGEQWIGAVFFMRMLAIASFFYMQEMFNRVIFKVFNRTGKILALELVKKAIQSVTIVLGIALMSIDVLVYGIVVTSVLSYLINFYQSRKVYGHVDWREILTLLRIIVAVATSVMTITFVNIYLKIGSVTAMFTVPALVVLYLWLLSLTNTVNVQKEVVAIKSWLSRT